MLGYKAALRAANRQECLLHINLRAPDPYVAQNTIVSTCAVRMRRSSVIG